MERKWLSADKENVDRYNVLKVGKQESKSLFKKKTKDCLFDVETNAESQSNNC